jgi:membrane-associated HD superfamily phosphohydrolase
MTKRDESGTKAFGFHRTLECFETLLTPTVSLMTVFGILDNCNVSLQSKLLTPSSVKSLVTNCVNMLLKLRSESQFDTVFQSAVTLATKLNGFPTCLTIVRSIVAWHCHGSAATQFETLEQSYRKSLVTVVRVYKSTKAVLHQFLSDNTPWR